MGGHGSISFLAVMGIILANVVVIVAIFLLVELCGRWLGKRCSKVMVGHSESMRTRITNITVATTISLAAIGMTAGLIHISFPYRITSLLGRLDAVSAITGFFFSLAALVAGIISRSCCNKARSDARSYRPQFHLTSASMVVAILGLFLSMTASMHSHGGASIPATRTSISAITVALDNYKSYVGAYPPEGSTLDALVTNSGVKGWAGPYLRGDHMPKDAWGNDFRYHLNNGVPLVISAGPDGKFGTADDLSN